MKFSRLPAKAWTRSRILQRIHIHTAHQSSFLKHSKAFKSAVRFSPRWFSASSERFSAATTRSHSLSCKVAEGRRKKNTPQAFSLFHWEGMPVSRNRFSCGPLFDTECSIIKSRRAVLLTGIRVWILGASQRLASADCG